MGIGLKNDPQSWMVNGIVFLWAQLLLLGLCWMFLFFFFCFVFDYSFVFFFVFHMFGETLAGRA